MNTIEIQKLINLLDWVIYSLIIICIIITFLFAYFSVRQKSTDVNKLKEPEETLYSSYVDKIFSEQEKAFLNTLKDKEERINYIQLIIANQNVEFFEKHKLLLEKDLEEIRQLSVKERFEATMHLMEKLIK